MDVYFVRHGETICNRRHIHQSPETPLTEKGRDEARTVAEYVRVMNPDMLITSEFARAKETADIIGSTLEQTPEVNPLFHEVRRPRFLNGRSHFNPLTAWYVFLSVMHRRNPAWRYDGSENFTDIRTRVQEALHFLESRTESHRSIVVVSHTIFINLITAYMCKNRILDLRDLLPSLPHVAAMKNGEVMHLKFVGEGDDCGCRWQLVK